jgi:excisionase family DNA binding protein
MLYTIDEIAKALGLNPRTIRRYIDQGKLRAERVGGSWRISEEAVKGMFSAPEVKEGFARHLGERSEDMLQLYLQGKHRLQRNGSVLLLVYVFNPSTEPNALARSAAWMAELNRLGQDAQFDFTMTGNELGLYRLTLIAPPKIAETMAAEWAK